MLSELRGFFLLEILLYFIYLSQNLKFLAPVFIDDLVRVKVTVEEIDQEKKKVKLQTECFKNEKKIISGEAVVLVNSKKDF